MVTTTMTAPAPARVLCALVALAAGIVGVAMLVAPRSTGDYFSWALGPPVLAATVGAFYVVSAVVFGWAAAREDWAGLRPLCVAVFGLTLPTLVATARHRDVFDFARWQALAWVVLFVASAVLFGLVLTAHERPTHVDGPRLPWWARVALTVLCVVYTMIAILLWTRPDTSGYGPIAAGGLGVRFLGSWAAFLAILAGRAAFRSGRGEVRMPLLALVLWPLAAFGAAAGHLGALRGGLPTIAYLLGSASLAAAAAVVASSRHVSSA